MVYDPREDTFLLLDALENDLPYIAKYQPALALEIGAGSGVVITALSVALGSKTYCMAVDISPVATLTTKNTAHINACQVDVMCGDLISGIQWNNSIDLLVFNPPYVPSEEGEDTTLLDKAWAGHHLGRSTTDILFPQLPDLMSSCSAGYIVVIEENQPDEMAATLETYGFKCGFIKSRNVRGEKLRILRFSRGIL